MNASTGGAVVERDAPVVVSNTEHALTVEQISSQIQKIQHVMAAVMKDKVHYGTIPGAGKKKVLLKAGAETLATVFRIAVQPKVIDLSTPDAIRYRIECLGTHQVTGILLGVGVGEASSDEEKYKWRAAMSAPEFESFPIDRRRVAFKKVWDEQTRGFRTREVQQVRTNPSDSANTILKMAKKRAQTDLILSALAASDIFDQDLDEDDDHHGEPAGARTVAEPKATAAAQTQTQAQPTQQRAAAPETQQQESQPLNATPIGSGPMLRIVQAQLDRAGERGIDAEKVCDAFGVKALSEIPRSKINEVTDFIKNYGRPDSAAPANE